MELGGERIGLLAFAGRAYLQAPLTTDHDAIIESLHRSKDELARDNAAIEQEKANLWGLMERLEKYIYIGRKLDAELVRIADVTEGDLDRQLKTAVAMAEPLMLFVIAAFIGTIFIGMVIPIFSLQEHIK